MFKPFSFGETDYPCVFMTVSDYQHSRTPKKLKMNRLQQQSSSTTSRNPRRCLVSSISSDDSDGELTSPEAEKELSVKIPL